MSKYKNWNQISTHTPVRVWPAKLQLLLIKKRISTHTPVRVWLFNHVRKCKISEISTHTPVRVWLIACEYRGVFCRFQLTHPWGCDRSPNKAHKENREFQLTHPWGCDILTQFKCDTYKYFNSHTREGVTTFDFLVCIITDFNSHTREGVTEAQTL